MKIGDRVGAIESADSCAVRMFGYGVYEGDHVRPDDLPGVFGSLAEIREAAIEANGPEKQWTEAQRRTFNWLASNPRIRLDSGDVVWGCQCWWGPEAEIKKTIGDRQVVIVSVPAENKTGPKPPATDPPPGDA